MKTSIDPLTSDSKTSLVFRTLVVVRDNFKISIPNGTDFLTDRRISTLFPLGLFCRRMDGRVAKRFDNSRINS